MIGVDDGLAQGNLDVADILFLIAALVAGGAVALSLANRPVAPFHVALAVSLCLLAFGWFLL